MRSAIRDRRSSRRPHELRKFRDGFSAYHPVRVMQKWLQLCHQGARYCGACLLSFGIWSLWLVLVLLLIGQSYIAINRELALPPVMLRALEERLAASGVRIEFGRASFDPTGQVLLQDARLFLPTFDEPVASVRVVHVVLNPWAMLAGRFEPRELDASGVTLSVPAMLSATGRAEPLVHDLDFAISPANREYTLTHLSGRLANLRVTAQGGLNADPLLEGRRDAPLPLATLLTRHYPEICRQLLAIEAQLNRLQAPRLDLLLTPSVTRGANVRVHLLAEQIDLHPEFALVARDVQVETLLPLRGDAPTFLRLSIAADTLQLPHGIRASHARSLVHGRLHPKEHRFDFLTAETTFASLSGQRLTATDVAWQVESGPLPELQGALTAHVLGEPVSVTGDVNLTDRTARVHTTGRFSPNLLAWIGQRAGRDLRPFIHFNQAPAFDLKAGFDPGWKFNGVEGRVAAKNVQAHRVRLDEVGGFVRFDGRHFQATDAFARLGTNLARGSFEQDLASREFRFLLRGRLDPPAIEGWFRQWWPNFWSNFDFSRTAPLADVDVAGRWGHGPMTTVFVLAECTNPVIRGVPLDHAITRIFVRPHFYDALEIFATRGGGAARGTFSRALADQGGQLKQMVFDFTSTLAVAETAPLVGPEIVAVTAPFGFTQSPDLTARGWINGPAAADAGRRDVRVTAVTSAPLTYHGFPLEHISFVAQMRDDVIDLSPVEVGFAGGIAGGRIMIDGPGTVRRLGFDLALNHASLREAAISLEKFSAHRRGSPLAPTSTYIEGTAKVYLDLTLSASGLLEDPYSFTGSGRADLSGPGLGRVRLLGLLSELVYFTNLSFDSLSTDFTVERTKLVFPNISLTGANAAINAHGDYLLAERTVDFNARIYPFQESKFILKTVVGAVLSPLSNVLEVKLTGQLEKPAWSLVMGPTNFFRALLQPSGPDRQADPNTSDARPAPGEK
jgi:hypothetical protein